MKECFEFIKKLWQNRRTRALAILIIYIIFFIFVFSIINSTDDDIPTDEFTYLKNIEIINYNVVGKYDTLVETYDSGLISGELIYQIVKNSTLESTNYRDNSNTYYLSINDYEKIKSNLTVEVQGAIRTTVSPEKITLDFSEYYGYIINIDIRS